MRRKHLFYTLVLLSAFMGAITTSLDLVIVEEWVRDPLVYGNSLFIAGVIVCFFFALFLSVKVKGKNLGQAFDPSFNRLRMIRRKELKYHIFSGLGNACSTLAYVSLFTFFTDPSTVLPFYQIVILYLLIIESVSEKNSPTMAELQACITVTFGAIMVSLSLGEINSSGLLIMFLVMNPASAVFSIYQRKLKSLRIDEKSNDSINIRFWNLVFTALFINVILFFLAPNALWDTVLVLRSHFGIIGLNMFISTIAFILFIRSLGMAKASVVQAIRSSSLIFVIPISIALSQFSVANPTFLLIKIMGIVLVVMGILSFSLTEVKSFLLIKTKSGFSVKRTMENVWNIKGIESVAMVAGEYDLVARVRTRTLGKGYKEIVNRIEEIEGIEDFSWNSTLKEWENV